MTIRTRTSREQFDRQAVHYNAQWNDWNKESLVWMTEHAHAEPSHRLLDVATGTGFTALHFAPQVAEVVGIDVSGGMLGQARERAKTAGIANATFRVAPAESIPFPEMTFDLVTCRIAAHHFNSAPGFVVEAARVLKPGGRLVVADSTVPDNEPEVDRWQNHVELLRDPSHVRNYTPAEWRGFVERAELRLEEMTTTGGSIPVTFVDWLRKSGCHGEPAAELRSLFLEAPGKVRQAFRIEPIEDGDIAFQWMRLVLSAIKPPRPVAQMPPSEARE
jgi:ubiquinone/menaquinone biosynthesis C-methylase UbiE